MTDNLVIKCDFLKIQQDFLENIKHTNYTRQFIVLPKMI